MYPKPVKTTSRVSSRLPLVGAMLLIVGAGSSVRPFVSDALPPPVGGFVTVTVYGPCALPWLGVVMFTVIWVLLSTVNEFTVIVPAPLKVGCWVTPLMKFVPVRTTLSVVLAFAIVGVMLVSVGTGLFTVSV